ncbi:MAG TPA: iron ABC transporter permease [Acetobacteraceae bacterium]|nr:iron ABC transporter permease [Acetobacteraceae bacterium]
MPSSVAFTAPGTPSATRTNAKPRADAVLSIAYVGVFAVVALLALIPVAALVLGSFRDAAPGAPDGNWTLANWAGLASPGVIDTLLNTGIVAGSTTVMAMLLGTAIALVIHRTDFRWPNAMTACMALCFYFPSFILAMAWIVIGSPGGLINDVLTDVLGIGWISVDIYSLGGIVFVMVLHQVPFVYLTMRGPIMGMDPAYEEASRTAGASALTMLRRVTLPMLSYALASSFLLCLVMALEQFGIPVLLGVPGRVTVLATQIYLLCRFPPTAYGLAAAVGLTLSVLTGLAIVLQRRLARGGRSVVTTGKAGRITPIPLRAWRWPVNILFGLYIALALVLPSLILLYTSLIKFFTANPFDAAFTWRNYTYVLDSPDTQQAILNTMIVSGGGALVGVLLGAACSYFTVRLRPTGYRMLDALVMVPFGIPGIVLGLGLLWAYAYLPVPLYGTLTLIVLAYVTRFLPYATETAGARFVQLDRSLEEAAWTSGASRPEGVWRIVLPLSLPSLQSGYFLLFMAFFREISATILIFTAATSVLSVSIWSAFEQANWGLASALSILAMLMMVVVMSVLLWAMPGARTR